MRTKASRWLTETSASRRPSSTVATHSASLPTEYRTDRPATRIPTTHKSSFQTNPSTSATKRDHGEPSPITEGNDNIDHRDDGVAARDGHSVVRDARCVAAPAESRRETFRSSRQTPASSNKRRPSMRERPVRQSRRTSQARNRRRCGANAHRRMPSSHTDPADDRINSNDGEFDQTNFQFAANNESCGHLSRVQSSKTPHSEFR